MLPSMIQSKLTKAYSYSNKEIHRKLQAGANKALKIEKCKKVTYLSKIYVQIYQVTMVFSNIVRSSMIKLASVSL